MQPNIYNVSNELCTVETCSIQWRGSVDCPHELEQLDTSDRCPETFCESFQCVHCAATDPWVHADEVIQVHRRFWCLYTRIRGWWFPPLVVGVFHVGSIRCESPEELLCLYYPQLPSEVLMDVVIGAEGFLNVGITRTREWE